MTVKKLSLASTFCGWGEKDGVCGDASGVADCWGILDI
jgi:hypothetical protein